MDMEAEEAPRQVHVRFTTRLATPFKAPNTSVAIPSHLSRLGLSTIVNNLLKSRDPDWVEQPFDFLIDGELVRMSLEQFLLAKGISAEALLEIEYIKAVVPCVKDDPSLHDDWVSAVDGTNPGFIFTGCYDSMGRIWKTGGVCTHILEGHYDAVTSVCCIKQEGNITVATGSKDRTLRLWKIDSETSDENPTHITAFKVLHGHRAAVQSIASHPSGELVCSGSWDCSINLWRTYDFNSEGDVVSVKKRKVNNGVDESQTEGESLSTLIGHTQCVSAVVWKQPETIFSSSWDHSIRRWDVESGKDTVNMFCGKALNSLDVGGESSSLVAAGGSDPILRVWDPRKPACKWHTKSWFHLVSASYDGKVMLWDLRTAWPLAVIDSHTDKVLCADWWRGNCVVTGGADSKLCISSEINI